MMAAQIAGARDLLNFYGTFYGLAVLGLTAGALKNKKPQLLIPLVPMTIAFAYQYDMAYYGKSERIVREAERILAEERHLLAMPGGAITLASIDAVLESREKERMLREELAKLTPNTTAAGDTAKKGSTLK